MTVRFNEAGPVQAENDLFIVENAGIGVRKPTSLSSPLTYSWVFGLKLKAATAVEGIVVEEVWPSSSIKPYLVVDKPEIRGVSWLQTTEPLDAAPMAAPWLYIDENNLFIFRFTVKRAGQAPSVVYQAAVISSASKRGTISRAMQALRQLQTPAKPASGA